MPEIVILPLILFLYSIHPTNPSPISGNYLINSNHLNCPGFSVILQIILILLYLILNFFSGMLVLFIYVASLASNEAFKYSSYLTGLNVTTSVLTALIILMTDPVLVMNFIGSSTAEHIDYQTSSTPFLILQIYNFPSTFMTTFIILYLLLTLLAVIKFTSVFFGPMRISK